MVNHDMVKLETRIVRKFVEIIEASVLILTSAKIIKF